MPPRQNVLIKILMDAVIILAVGLPILILYLEGDPFERGFFCDDDSIRYPYKDSTVTNVALYLIGIFLPAVTIFGNELFRILQSKEGNYQENYLVFGRSIPPLVWVMYKQIGVFLFGACVSQLLTDIAKYKIGRLRPHFLYVCAPSVDCSTQYDKHAYIMNYTCTGRYPDKIREARLSFPSGHSSFSAYTMTYLIFYVQARMNLRKAKLLGPGVQLVLFILTWYTALSRVSDYKHHWSDVLVGLLLGIVTAIIVVNFVSDFFPNRGKSENERKAFQNSSGMATTSNYDAIDLEQQ